MDLDLRKDSTEIYEYVVARASSYQPSTHPGPGESEPIKMIYAGYEFDQRGWFALIFDRRPDAAHDGEWTGYLDGNMLERPSWTVARERNDERPIQVRTVDGSTKAFPPGTEFGPLIGRMLVEVLQRAEREGVFSRLPRANELELGLEEFNGSLGWSSLTGFGGEPE
jgi:hypothetical protein